MKKFLFSLGIAAFILFSSNKSMAQESNCVPWHTRSWQQLLEMPQVNRRADLIKAIEWQINNVESYWILDEDKVFYRTKKQNNELQILNSYELTKFILDMYRETTGTGFNLQDPDSDNNILVCPYVK